MRHNCIAATAYVGPNKEDTRDAATHLKLRKSDALQPFVWHEWNCPCCRVWCVSETKDKGLHNCGHTSYVVWCIDLCNSKGTRSTTRRKRDECAK